MILFDKVPLAHYITNLWQWDVDWEEQNPEYRCLLRRLHVVNAAKALLLLEMLVIPIYVLFLFPYWIFWIGIPVLFDSIIKKTLDTQ
ncbi:hypothetical protein ANCDUO_01505 [Ancylostoma duodenale]|uniref:Uncharacterized protein n=1 Tax=Ancylostoma duodenale TaxID=51022 RepID=A0A0C2HF28_9BILA|nr:hypothetical protein ANCDUO_01505 [Ancylostoma duodenale]